MKIFKTINKLSNYKPILAIILISICFICSSCKKRDIISKRTMSQIISELYLSDEYIEQNPKYRGQTDSLRLYPGIIKKYGYTMDDYERSIKYYLEDKETYKELHIKAKQILQKREEELTIIQIGKDKYLESQSHINNWWALDSLKSLSDMQIAKDKFLFILKNINKTNNDVNKNLFRITDTTKIYPNIWNRLEFVDTAKFKMLKEFTFQKNNKTNDVKKGNINEIKRDDINEIKRDDINEIKRDFLNDVKKEDINNIKKERIKPKKQLDLIQKIDNN